MRLGLLLLVFGVALRSLHAEAPLRLVGSTTVTAALEPRHTALEQALGRPVEFAGAGTTAGLLSLVAGGADLAMLSQPLDAVAQAINEKSPGKVDTAALQAEQIGDARIVFIVNPRNAVRALTAEQLADILTGKIVNWDQVGGPTSPIEVVSLANGGSLLRDHLLHGRPVSAQATFVTNATQIPVIVARDAHAIGVISATHPRGKTSLVKTDARIAAPLFLVARKDRAELLRQVAAAARALLTAESE